MNVRGVWKSPEKVFTVWKGNSMLIVKPPQIVQNAVGEFLAGSVWQKGAEIQHGTGCPIQQFQDEKKFVTGRSNGSSPARSTGWKLAPGYDIESCGDSC